MFSTKAKTIISFPFRLAVQIFLPYQSLYSPTHNMLNAAPKKKQDHMLQDWKERTLFELNFIGLVVSTLSSLFESTRAHSTGNTPRLHRSSRPRLARRNTLERSRPLAHRTTLCPHRPFDRCAAIYHAEADCMRRVRYRKTKISPRGANSSNTPTFSSIPTGPSTFVTLGGTKAWRRRALHRLCRCEGA